MMINRYSYKYITTLSRACLALFVLRVPMGNYTRINLYEQALRTSHTDAIKSVAEDIKDSGYLGEYLKGLGKMREGI